MRGNRRGFTLVEMIVTTIVIGVIAAIVIPAVAKQVTAGDPARVVSDLNNVKTGIEIFANNVRPKFPGDIEDLVNPISGFSGTVGDKGLDGASYTSSEIAAWKGPYVEWSFVPGVSDAQGTDNVFETANGYPVVNGLQLCDASTALNGCSNNTSNRYVTIQAGTATAPVPQGMFEKIDEVIDGAANSSTGLLRWNGTSLFFLAVPYTAP